MILRHVVTCESLYALHAHTHIYAHTYTHTHAHVRVCTHTCAHKVIYFPVNHL